MIFSVSLAASEIVSQTVKKNFVKKLSRTKNENDFLVRIKTETLLFCLPIGR